MQIHFIAVIIRTLRNPFYIEFSFICCKLYIIHYTINEQTVNLNQDLFVKFLNQYAIVPVSDMFLSQTIFFEFCNQLIYIRLVLSFPFIIFLKVYQVFVRYYKFLSFLEVGNSGNVKNGIDEMERPAYALVIKFLQHLVG